MLLIHPPGSRFGAPGFAVSLVLPTGSVVQYVASRTAAVALCCAVLCCDGTGGEGCSVIWRPRMVYSARQ